MAEPQGGPAHMEGPTATCPELPLTRVVDLGPSVLYNSQGGGTSGLHKNSMDTGQASHQGLEPLTVPLEPALPVVDSAQSALEQAPSTLDQAPSAQEQEASLLDVLAALDKQDRQERVLRTRHAKRARGAADPRNRGAEAAQEGPGGEEALPAVAPVRTKGGRGTGRGGGKRAQEMTVEQVEMETAYLVGLSENQVEEEEAITLPPGTNHALYIKVRNHVLARWRMDVNRYLGVVEAAASIREKYIPMVEVAWNYLNTQGFINFGVAPALLKDPTVRLATRPTVIIIGAGLAGAAAARQLSKWDFRVVVLEGRNRPGGRVWSMALEGGGHAGSADLGGAIITGIDGNPLAVLAKQMGIPMHNIRDTCPMYLEGGGLAPEELDAKVHSQHNTLLDAAHEYRDELPPEVTDVCSMGSALSMLWEDVEREPGSEELQERLMRWHFSNVEFANAARVGTLSLRSWDQDDPYEMLGDHIMLPGGNVRLVEGLLQDVPVLYNSVVREVRYGGNGVTVTTQDAVLAADAVLVTVPLGVFKRQSIAFHPPLPDSKQSAIKRLGFGLLNKVVLLFPHQFWNPDLDLFGHVAKDPADSGLFFLFYAFHSRLAGKGAVLGALVSGDSAERFETLPVQEATDRVMRVLRGMHEPFGITVPDPLQSVATRWGADPLAGGSYSSVSVGSTGDDYVTMAQDIRGRVFFGGEATIIKWPATMHGAYLSGLREAAKIKTTFEGSRKRKRSAAESELMEEMSEESDHEPIEIGSSDSEMEVEAAVVGLAGAGDEGDEEEDDEGREALALSVGLHRLFEDGYADVAFGCLAAFYGPSNSEWNDSVLMQIDFQGMRNGPKKPVILYAVVTRGQLSELRNTPGGNEPRMALLMNTLKIPLVGRPLEGSPCVAFFRALMRDRGMEWLLDPGAEPPLTPFKEHVVNWPEEPPSPERPEGAHAMPPDAPPGEAEAMPPPPPRQAPVTSPGGPPQQPTQAIVVDRTWHPAIKGWPGTTGNTSPSTSPPVAAPLQPAAPRQPLRNTPPASAYAGPKGNDHSPPGAMPARPNRQSPFANPAARVPQPTTAEVFPRTTGRDPASQSPSPASPQGGRPLLRPAHAAPVRRVVEEVTLSSDSSDSDDAGQAGAHQSEDTDDSDEVLMWEPETQPSAGVPRTVSAPAWLPPGGRILVQKGVGPLGRSVQPQQHQRPQTSPDGGVGGLSAMQQPSATLSGARPGGIGAPQQQQAALADAIEDVVDPALLRLQAHLKRQAGNMSAPPGASQQPQAAGVAAAGQRSLGSQLGPRQADAADASSPDASSNPYDSGTQSGQGLPASTAAVQPRQPSLAFLAAAQAPRRKPVPAGSKQWLPQPAAAAAAALRPPAPAGTAALRLPPAETAAPVVLRPPAPAGRAAGPPVEPVRMKPVPAGMIQRQQPAGAAGLQRAHSAGGSASLAGSGMEAAVFVSALGSPVGGNQGVAAASGQGVQQVARTSSGGAGAQPRPGSSGGGMQQQQQRPGSNGGDGLAGSSGTAAGAAGAPSLQILREMVAAIPAPQLGRKSSGGLQ